MILEKCSASMKRFRFHIHKHLLLKRENTTFRTYYFHAWTARQFLGSAGTFNRGATFLQIQILFNWGKGRVRSTIFTSGRLQNSSKAEHSINMNHLKNWYSVQSGLGPSKCRRTSISSTVNMFFLLWPAHPYLSIIWYIPSRFTVTPWKGLWVVTYQPPPNWAVLWCSV